MGDFDEIMEAYGDDYSSIDFVDDAAEDFKSHIETNDLTNAITQSVFDSLESWVNQHQLGHGNTAVIMRINTYVNGDDSHIYVSTNGNRSQTQLYNSGDLKEVFNKELARMIADAIMDKMYESYGVDVSNVDKAKLEDDIYVDIIDGRFDDTDIKTFLDSRSGTLEGSLKEYTDDLCMDYKENAAKEFYMAYELQTFGIYPDTIEDNVSLAQQVRDEFEDIMQDYSDDYDKVDISEEAKQDLKHNGIDLDNITNAIIGSSFHILESSINDINIGHGDTTMSLNISSYVNGDDSHLYASVFYNDGSDNTAPQELYDGDDLRDAFNDGLANMICDKAIDALLDGCDDSAYDENYKRLYENADSIINDIRKDISDGAIGTDDIRTFLNKGTFEGSLKEAKDNIKNSYGADKSIPDRDL